MTRSDREYERVARIEPYFGVIPHRQFRMANLDTRSRQEFFGSGEEYARRVLGTVRLRIDDAFIPRRVLDFGCGVGRLLIPLALRAESAVGVDVSEAMMDEASRNCRERGLRNVEFIKSDDDLSGLGAQTFDLINSSIVFQHIAPRRVERIVRVLLRHLEPGGVGVMQFNIWMPMRKRLARSLKRTLPPFNVAANLVRGRPWNLGLIEMNALPFNRVMTLLIEAGITAVYADFKYTYAGPSDDQGVVVFFQSPARP